MKAQCWARSGRSSDTRMIPRGAPGTGPASRIVGGNRYHGAAGRTERFWARTLFGTRMSFPRGRQCRGAETFSHLGCPRPLNFRFTHCRTPWAGPHPFSRRGTELRRPWTPWAGGLPRTPRLCPITDRTAERAKPSATNCAVSARVPPELGQNNAGSLHSTSPPLAHKKCTAGFLA
jgi:hypothetical protein